MTENWINNAMHTLLEGVVPTTMGAVIFSISQKCEKVTVDSINQQILKIFAILVVEQQTPSFVETPGTRKRNDTEARCSSAVGII